MSLAGLCADLHAAIVDTTTYETVPKESSAYEADPEAFQLTLGRISDRAEKLYGRCLQLRLLMPIMAEAFINMTILIFCKDEIKNDPARYQAFLRAKFPDRLALLSEYCDGFVRGIDFGTEAYANFKESLTSATLLYTAMLTQSEKG